LHGASSAGIGIVVVSIGAFRVKPLPCYCPGIAPGAGFRSNAVSGLSDAFSFRKRCSVYLAKENGL